MRPMWVRGVTYSTTPVPTLKRWSNLLHQHLCYTLGESNKKLQELFGKLAGMRGAHEKLAEAAATTTVVQEVAVHAKGDKRGRGAAKKRSADM
jgi:hypothetical protein